MKFCIDCKHVSRFGHKYICRHDKALNKVTGKADSQAERQRALAPDLSGNYCGENAGWFEPALEKVCIEMKVGSVEGE